VTREWSAAFAADLHLSAGDGEGLARAGELLATCARRSARLFLLGDVFDLWISGDELSMPEFAPLFASIRSAVAAGLRVDFLAGNRDFNFTRAHGEALGVAVARRGTTSSSTASGCACCTATSSCATTSPTSA
jgi:UDP-2,3-diacylglucosamine hydrolase